MEAERPGQVTNPDKLYGRIIVAALWIALLIPVVGKIYHCWHFCGSDFSVNNNFLILAAFGLYNYFVFPLFFTGHGNSVTNI